MPGPDDPMPPLRADEREELAFLNTLARPSDAQRARRIELEAREPYDPSVPGEDPLPPGTGPLTPDERIRLQALRGNEPVELPDETTERQALEQRWRDHGGLGGPLAGATGQDLTPDLPAQELARIRQMADARRNLRPVPDEQHSDLTPDDRQRMHELIARTEQGTLPADTMRELIGLQRRSAGQQIRALERLSGQRTLANHEQRDLDAARARVNELDRLRDQLAVLPTATDLMTAATPSAAAIARDLATADREDPGHDCPTEVYFDGDWIGVRETAAVVRDMRWNAIQGMGPDQDAPDCIRIHDVDGRLTYLYANDVRGITDLTTTNEEPSS